MIQLSWNEGIRHNCGIKYYVSRWHLAEFVQNITSKTKPTVWYAFHIPCYACIMFQFEHDCYKMYCLNVLLKYLWWIITYSIYLILVIFHECSINTVQNIWNVLIRQKWHNFSSIYYSIVPVYTISTYYDY